MPIPNAEQAIIAPEKLREYLLSPDHPRGQYKAHFFNRLGFSAVSWERLEHALRSQHLVLDPAAAVDSQFGRVFVIRGPLTGPAGEMAPVVTVWIIREGENVPRLVTAYPGVRR